METSTSFLIGCVGAIAPEILRFYKLRSSIRINWSWSYILVSIPFMLLGGLVACLLEPQNYYAAFYTGISTPFIVNAIVKETQQVEKSQDIPVVNQIPLNNPLAIRHLPSSTNFGSVCIAGTTSTNFIRGAGLKK